MLDHLPHHIFLEILFRVPVNSLVKCTSVSKTWHSLIKSSEFIYAHLKSSISRNTIDPHLVRMLRDENMGLSLNFESLESNQRYHKQLNIPQVLSSRHDHLRVIGYSNGIVCYSISQKSKGRIYHRYLLWNPSIQKYLTLPQSNYECHAETAFVFDSNANDFKLFAAREHFEVELYSLRNHSWKIINVSDRNIFYFGYTLVKGVIYFVGYKSDPSKYEKKTSNLYIFGFNLADEIFHKIRLPDSFEGCTGMFSVQYGNTSIALVAYYDNRIELWVTEEISVSGTWKKVLDMSYDYSYQIFGVWNRSLLFEKVGGQVSSLDLKCQHVKDVGLILGPWTTYSSTHRYEETLALLDNGKDISIMEEDIGILDDSSDSD